MPIITVTEYHNYLNTVLEGLKFAVKGEVSGFKIAQDKWVTFDLKDKNSKVSCFTTIYKQSTPLQEGAEIICYGSPKIYVPYGRYSFNVEVIELVGEGALKKAFDAAKKKLEEEGLFDPCHKKCLPSFPEKIGIISSKEAAAYTDILKILDNRWSGLQIYLYSTLVQGVHAAPQVAEAVSYFNQKFPVDVIIIGRGGGSLEELQAFNSEEVCRAIFASRIPVITGIGHERDVTLADLVADCRASTPTNAAEIAVPDKKELLKHFEKIEDSWKSSFENRIGGLISELERASLRIFGFLDLKRQNLNNLEAKIKKNLDFLSARAEMKLKELNLIGNGLDKMFVKLWQGKKEKLEFSESLLVKISPEATLSKGYSLTYNEKTKKIVKSAGEVIWGDRFKTRFNDGEVRSIVDKVLTSQK